MDQNFTHRRRQARAIAIAESVAQQNIQFVAKFMVALASSFALIEAGLALHRMIVVSP